MSPKVKKKNRKSSPPLWAGLLLLGSLAPLSVAAEDDSTNVQVHGGLISVNAENVFVSDLVLEIALQNNLRLVQHVALDRRISIEIREKPLGEVLDQILDSESYQLYHMVTSVDDSETGYPVPGALWIFSEGSAVAPAAMAFLETVLWQGDYREKKEAIRELRRLASPEAIQTLSIGLGDDDRRIRQAAMEALANIGGDEALAAIASASMDDDAFVRGQAAEAVAMAEGSSALDYLSLAMQDEDPRVRAAAVGSLGDLGDDGAAYLVREALNDPDEAVRERAIEVLDEMQGDAAFRAFFSSR